MEATPQQEAWITGREAERKALLPKLSQALALLDQALELLREWEPADLDDEVKVAVLDTKRDALVREYNVLNVREVRS